MNSNASYLTILKNFPHMTYCQHSDIHRHSLYSNLAETARKSERAKVLLPPVRSNLWQTAASTHPAALFLRKSLDPQPKYTEKLAPLSRSGKLA
jgi:hypothetical protein